MRIFNSNIPTCLISPNRLGLLLTLLLMLINLNNSATKSIPTSDLICPLILWILMSAAFVTFALAEYFAILVLLRFGNKVGEIKVDTAILISGILSRLQKL